VVEADAATHGAASSAGVVEGLSRLSRLASVEAGGQAFPWWRQQVAQELATLARLTANRISGSWMRVPASPASTCRPDLLAHLERWTQQREAHAAGLDLLRSDVAAVGDRLEANRLALHDRIRRWVDEERRLQARGPELIFRMFWDDLGGQG